MLKGALNVIVIIIFIFIFLVWFLDLTASNQTEGNLIKMLEGAVIEAGKSFKEFKDNINLFRGEKSFVPLNETEIDILKEKILQHEDEEKK